MTLIRFSVVGGINTLVDFGVMNFLIWCSGAASGVGLLACNGAAFIAANLNSYFLNKGWTFEERSRSTSGEYLLFLVFSFGGLALNSLVLYLLTDAVPFSGALPLMVKVNGAKVGATLATMAWNYSTYRQFVFRRKIEPIHQTFPS